MVMFETSHDSWLVRKAAASLDAERLVDTVVASCVESVFPARVNDAEFLTFLRASTSQNVHGLREVIAGRITADAVELDEVLGFATAQAQMHIPQKSMQRSYRVSFFVQWEAWIRELSRFAEVQEVSRADLADAFTQLTRVIFSYQDFVASQVAETYTRDQETLNRSRAHVRQNLVRTLLRDDEGTLSPSDIAILAYSLDLHHVAVLLPEMPEGAAAQLADGLRTATNAHQTLMHPLSLHSTVAWLGRQQAWHPAAVEALVDILRKVAVTSLVSDPCAGVDGFRRSLQQAQDAERVRHAWGSTLAPTTLRYSEVRLEILLLQNPELAQDFVTAELGPLAQSTVQAARLRQTLEASYRFGSHVATAEHLQLHEHTVRNRLRRAEDLLGHSLRTRRTELQVAIRLVRLLEGASANDLAGDYASALE